MTEPHSDSTTKTGLSSAMEERLLAALQTACEQAFAGKRITRKCDQ